MASKAVSISRTLGAHGEAVGRLVAAELAFRYVDNEIINKAAQRAGVSPEAVASQLANSLHSATLVRTVRSR